MSRRLPSTFKVGTIGTICLAYKNSNIYRVLSNGDWWGYSGDDLKLVKNAQKPTDKIRNILNRHISNKAKMKLIAEVVALNKTYLFWLLVFILSFLLRSYHG